MAEIDWRNLGELIQEVRNDRMNNKTCVSAQPDISVSAVLDKLIESGYYKNDYENVTSVLLNENVKYDTAIQSIREVAASGLFDTGFSDKKFI